MSARARAMCACAVSQSPSRAKQAASTRRAATAERLSMSLESPAVLTPTDPWMHAHLRVPPLRLASSLKRRVLRPRARKVGLFLEYRTRTATRSDRQCSFRGLAPAAETPERTDETPLSWNLEIDDAAPQSNHDRVGPVAGSELRQNFADLSLDGLFAQTEPSGDLFVGFTLGNQAQHADLRRSERVVGGMLGELIGGLRGKRLSAGVHGTDSLPQLSVQRGLEKVGLRTGLERSQNVYVARIGGQHDDACLGKFAADCNDGIEAGHLRHLQVHVCNVGPVGPELLDGIASIVGFGDQLHVRFASHEACD